jgi:phosphonate transport system substrate-binding protein
MTKRICVVLLAVAILALPILASGCALVEPKLGSERKPVKLYFVPSVEVSVIVESGEAIADYLKEQTGYEFEVRVPTTYAAVIEEMGAAEGDAMAFIPALGYVLANDKYETEVALATVRYGWAFYWTQYIVRRDSGLETLEDLNGKIWALPSISSTSGYLVPKSEFMERGIEPAEEVDVGGHPQVVIAVYEGEADFGTCYFSAPGDNWTMNDSPEPEGEIEVEEVEGSLRAYKGGQRIRDARSAVLNTYPDVIDQVTILDISAPIPNDTVSFSKDFPEEAKEAIVQGLLDYADTEEGQTVLANDRFYDITGFSVVDDSNFESVRTLIREIGLTEEDILD